MITDADIKKMKAVFATKEDLKLLSNRFEIKFLTKEELKKETSTLNKKIDFSIREVLDFISEIKNEIMNELNDFRMEVNVFREEVSEFRVEMRDINRTNQSALNNHESRITHLEYIKKSS